jgi:hypothetical protein
LEFTLGQMEGNMKVIGTKENNMEKGSSQVLRERAE